MSIYIISLLALFAGFHAQANIVTCTDLSGSYANSKWKVAVKQSSCDVFDYTSQWSGFEEKKFRYEKGVQTVGNQDGITCRLFAAIVSGWVPEIPRAFIIGCKQAQSGTAEYANLSVFQLSSEGDLVVQPFAVDYFKLDLENPIVTVNRSFAPLTPEVLFRQK